MNKLITSFLFILLGLSALLFYNVDQLKKELDTLSLVITQLDNRVFMLKNQKITFGSAKDDELRLYNVPARLKDQPYCEDPKVVDYEIIYGDMETGSYRTWRLGTQQETFSLDEQNDVEGKFIIEGLDILVNVTDSSDGEKIEASLKIIDMQPNGEILAYKISSDVKSIKNCPEYVKEAFQQAKAKKDKN